MLLLLHFRRIYVTLLVTNYGKGALTFGIFLVVSQDERLPFFQAVETLKMFEKKDSRVKSAAATNLSFLYFLVSNSLDW